eukprot:13116634-Heterocapsa_arctica.AAC.1
MEEGRVGPGLVASPRRCALADEGCPPPNPPATWKDPLGTLGSAEGLLGALAVALLAFAAFALRCGP